MCESCTNRSSSPPGRITRRHFLQLAFGGGVAAVLAACDRSPQPEVTIPPLPTPAPAGPNPPASFPTIAGQSGQAAPGRFTVLAPVGGLEYPLDPEFRYYNPFGELVGREPPPAGVSLIAWVGAAGVYAAQRLPPISAASDIPTGPLQPQPGGETRPLGPLTMITRAGWGAAPRQFSPGGESGPYDPVSNPGGWLDYPEPLAAQLTGLAVHHSALEFWQGPQEVQRLHMGGRSFADVGYHFLIDGLGQVYEGRPVGARGAHVGGHNTGVIGVCLLGNFEEVRPVQAQLDSLRTLTRYLAATYTLTHLAGHRDFQPGVTVCPGANLYPQLPGLAAETGLTYGIGD